LKVKICGITRAEDARMAIEYGADALGFVHELTSPRALEDEAAKWIGDLPPFVVKVAVFGRVDRAPAKSFYDFTQGVEWDVLPEAAPKRIHVLRLRKGQKANDFVMQTVNSGALLLDAFREEAYGGTGHTVDWELAAEIVQRSVRPVILAGGLNASNVQEAVRRVRPYAVDVSSGVERSSGIKDWEKMREFIELAKSA
jgi:phosphoribosylanthranilate isomerase